MFEVLAFVYENYWRGDTCPELPALQRKLNAVGFDDAEIQDALIWLEDLKSAAGKLPSHALAEPAGHTESQTEAASPSTAMRILTAAEQSHLGLESWGFVAFLVSAGVLPWDRLELVMERVMATHGSPICLDDLKLIVLMMFWSLGEEPDALILDELCDNRAVRQGH